MKHFKISSDLPGFLSSCADASRLISYYLRCVEQQRHLSNASLTNHLLLRSYFELKSLFEKQGGATSTQENNLNTSSATVLWVHGSGRVCARTKGLITR